MEKNNPNGQVNSSPQKNKWQDYRKECVESGERSHEKFDKTVLTLSSGALALSLTFTKDLIPLCISKYNWLLMLCWGFWALSLCIHLFGLFASTQTFEKKISQIDKGLVDEIRKKNEHLGEPYRNIVIFCNLWGMVSFVLGVFAIIIFIIVNLEVLGL